MKRPFSAQATMTAIACAAVLMVPACSRSPSTGAVPGHAPTAKSAEGPASTRTGPVPSRHAQSVDGRLTSDDNLASFAALIAALPAAQQVKVREWYRSVDAPSMESATAAQVAWMRERHYPMPEDIARAESMTTAELKSAARVGDLTAQILFVVRRFDEMSDESHLANPAAVALRQRSPVDATEGMLEILGSGSPIAGYLYPAYQQATAKFFAAHGMDIDQASQDRSVAIWRLGGLVWASKLGDGRATLLLRDPQLQAVDAFNAGMAIQVILMQALHANPELLRNSVVQMPTGTD